MNNYILKPIRDMGYPIRNYNNNQDMYISCPACDTKFVVTEKQIGNSGRKVKCSKCGNIWHYKKKLQDNIDQDLKKEKLLSKSNQQELSSVISPLGNGVNLPALRPTKIPHYLYTMPFIMVGLILLMITMVFASNLGSESSLNTSNVIIKDIKIEHNKNIGKILVSYKLYNVSDKQMKIPLIRIRIFDRTNRIIKSKLEDYTHMDMLPDQFVQIKTEFIPAPESAENIDIMIGNRVDFMLR